MHKDIPQDEMKTLYQPVPTPSPQHSCPPKWTIDTV